MTECTELTLVYRLGLEIESGSYINRVRPIKGLVTPPPPPEICAKINTHCHACVTLVLALVHCNIHTGG